VCLEFGNTENAKIVAATSGRHSVAGLDILIAICEGMPSATLRIRLVALSTLLPRSAADNFSSGDCVQQHKGPLKVATQALSKKGICFERTGTKRECE